MNNTIDDLPRFYASDAAANSNVVLSPEDTKHCKVLRLQIGNKVHIINGQGMLFEGHFQLEKRSVSIQNLKLIAQESSNPNRLVLAVCPTKNMTRFEWVIEKATEVGVKTIIPLLAEHSERIHLKSDRLERIMISAMKQSKALWKTEISELKTFQELMSFDASEKFIAHCKESEYKAPFNRLTDPAQNRLIAIGPEGDFSITEINAAKTAGFEELSLGSKRLRTETAAIAACIASEAL